MKATSSAMNVAFGTRKLLSPPLLAARRVALVTDMRGLLPQDEDEVGHEAQVDEVHRLDQADRQEQDREQLGPRLGLTGDARNRLGASQAVTDGCADGATTEGEATAHHGSRGLDRGYELGICCHCLSSVRGSWCGAS